MKNEVKVTSLINGKYIIGKTTYSGNLTHIEDPYQLIPDPNGLQMLPFDEWILGRKIQVISLDNRDVIYSEETGSELKNLYLESLLGESGIEIPKQDIIV